MVTLTYDDGAPGERSELYQLPLAFYAEPQDRLDHAFVGWWEDPDWAATSTPTTRVHDRDAMAGWLHALRRGSGRRARLAFHRLPGHDLDTEAHSTLFSGEQSNSSLAFGDDSLLKVFRKVTPGANPDIAVHRVLTEAGSDHVAHLYGWLEAPGHRDVDLGPQLSRAATRLNQRWAALQLAMLQQFLRTATDGWELALASVRNLFAEADLHADEVGGDFAAEAARLGESLAEVHQSLAAHFPTQRPDRRSAGRAGRSDGRPARRRARRRPRAGAVRRPACARRYAAVADARRASQVQRIHGDLHLGQTLRTVKGWKIVDFEGEPAKPLAERVLPDSRVARRRRHAAVLRLRAPRAERTAAQGADDTGAEQRSYRAAEWAERNCAAFLSAYAGRDLTGDEQALLDAYVADKAVYEAVYEARNRPTWVPVPLTAIERLAG